MTFAICICSAASLPTSCLGRLCGSKSTVHSRQDCPSLYSLAHPSREQDWNVASKGDLEFRRGAGRELCCSYCWLTLPGEWTTPGHSHTRWLQLKVAPALLVKQPNAYLTILGQNDLHIITKLQTGDSLVNHCWPWYITSCFNFRFVLYRNERWSIPSLRHGDFFTGTCSVGFYWLSSYAP